MGNNDNNNDDGSGDKCLADHDELSSSSSALPSSSANNNITVRIIREREQVLPVQVSPAIDNVYALKQRLLKVVTTTNTNEASTTSTTCTNPYNNPYIRLIAAGRLLAPDSALLAEFALSDNQVIHAVILDRPPPSLQQQSLQSQWANHHHHHHHHHHNNNSGGGIRTGADDDDYDEEEEGVYYQEEEEEEVDDDDPILSPLLLPEEEDDSGIVDLDQMEMGTLLQRPNTRTRTTRTPTSRGRRAVGRPPAPHPPPTRQQRHQQQQPPPQQRRRLPLGFDRLRMTASLRRTEITVLRMYFNSHIDAFLRDRPELVAHLQQLEPIDTLRRRRYAEQAWMEAQSPTSDFAMNVMDQQHHYHNGVVATTMTTAGGGGGNPIGGGLVGLQRSTPPLLTTTTTRSNHHHHHRNTTDHNNREFIWGFLLGYFVGYYMLIWVWIPSIPYRQKMGILAGYCLSLTMGLLHGSNQIGIINQQRQHQDFDHHEYLDDSLLPPMME